MVSGTMHQRTQRRMMIRDAAQTRIEKALKTLYSAELGSPEANAARERYYKEWDRVFRLMFGRIRR